MFKIKFVSVNERMSSPRNGCTSQREDFKSHSNLGQEPLFVSGPSKTTLV